MTPFPYSIGPDASLDDAEEMMRNHDIRHLPVCENHVVLGVLSERELRAGIALRNASPAALDPRVTDVCLSEPLLVDLDARLDAVAAEMATRRIGSAVVMRGDKLAGILTTTDVCRILAELLRDLAGDEDDDVA